MKTPNRQQGTAIVVALFVTALVAAISVAMLVHARTDTRRTELLLNNIQANLYAEGSLGWARQALINNLLHPSSGQVIDPTPITSSTDHLGSATISATIEDAESLLNLNNLTNTTWQAIFFNLIHEVAPKLSAEKAKKIQEAITDWITVGLKDSPFDKRYARQRPPWQAPHRPMSSVSELRLVDGMTPALFEALAPFVTALPIITPININNAPLEVLMALSDAVTREQAEAFISARKRAPLTTLPGNAQMLKDHSIELKLLTVQSQYFLVKSTVALGDQRETVYTLLSRTHKDKQPVIGIVWQSKGTL